MGIYPDELSIKTITLDPVHRKLGARMAPFAGYEMPVQYPTGVMKEHIHTRNSASLFDVSHMGQLRIHGSSAAESLEKLVPSDITTLEIGQTRYTMFTNNQGGILDDLMVTQYGKYLYLVINAARKEADIAHLRKCLSRECELEILEECALLALQGPKASEVIARFTEVAPNMKFMSATQLHISDIPCFVTRSGYTGEDGYEISVPINAAEELFQLFLDIGEVMPAGLGARDSLRLEAGLCLYGSDINETITPIEANLLWTISKRRRESGGFPGDTIIQEQIAKGVTKKRVGIQPQSRVPARANTEITDANGETIGIITSGGFGPTVGRPISMGYINSPYVIEGTNVNLKIRGKSIPAIVCSTTFIQHNYYRG